MDYLTWKNEVNELLGDYEVFVQSRTIGSSEIYIEVVADGRVILVPFDTDVNAFAASVFGLPCVPKKEYAWEEYLRFVSTTCIYPEEHLEECLTLGFLSELGEVAGVFKKKYRDGGSRAEWNKKFMAELGDCLWYAAALELNGYGEVGDPLAKGKTFVGIIQTAAEQITAERTIDTQFIRRYIASFFDVSDVIAANIKKLKGRQARGTIKGDGDDR